MSFFVVRHVFSTTASRPNAGADGLQKTHYLGGTERARISEQCLRRALLDGGLLLPLAEQSVRTRQIATMVADRLKAQRVADEIAAEAGKAVATLLSKGSRRSAAEGGGDEQDTGGEEVAEENEGEGSAAVEGARTAPAKKTKVAVLAISE